MGSERVARIGGSGPPQGEPVHRCGAGSYRNARRGEHPTLFKPKVSLFARPPSGRADTIGGGDLKKRGGARVAGLLRDMCHIPP